MGEAKRRRAQGLPGRLPNPQPFTVQSHVLALLDRRVERDEATQDIVFLDHSAKPGTYCSADMKTLYQWDGIMLRRLDRHALKSDIGSA